MSQANSLIDFFGCGASGRPLVTTINDQAARSISLSSPA
jgi:hypothetical protein